MRTKTQERTLQLRQAIQNHVRDAEIPNRVTSTKAFGMRLLQLIEQDRSKDFLNQTHMLRDQARRMFANDVVSGEEYVSARADFFNSRAKIYDEQRMGKQAAFARAMASIMKALCYADSRYQFPNFLAEAAAKAVYAGANADAVQQASLLVF